MRKDRLQSALLESLADHLTTGERLRVPAGGELLWRWFNDLSATRSVGFGGPNPIAPSEIESYFRLMRWPVEPRHIDIVLAMDRTYLDHVASQISPSARTRTMRKSPTLDSASFDAAFG